MNKQQLEAIEWRLTREVQKYRRAEWMTDNEFVANCVAKIAAMFRKDVTLTPDNASSIRCINPGYCPVCNKK